MSHLDVSLNPRPSVRRALRRAISLAWDRIGLVIVLNLGWMALVVLSGMLIGGIVGLLSPHPPGVPVAGPASRAIILIGNLCTALAAGGLAAGPAAVMACCFGYEPVGLAEFVSGIVRYGARFAALTAAAIVIAGGCFLYFEWFLAAPSLRLLAPLILYPVGAWVAVMPYQFALVSLEDRTASDAIRRSMLLLLDNPLFSLVGGAAAAGVAVILGVTRVGLGLAAVTLWLTIAQASTLEVMWKYRPDPLMDELYGAGESTVDGDSERPDRASGQDEAHP